MRTTQRDCRMIRRLELFLPGRSMLVALEGNLEGNDCNAMIFAVWYILKLDAAYNSPNWMLTEYWYEEQILALNSKKLASFVLLVMYSEIVVMW